MNAGPKTWVQYDKSLPYIEDKTPDEKPVSHLEKDGENSYKVVEGRRQSKMLLVNKIREAVDKWRDEGYPGATATTKELLTYWFDEDHIVDGEDFKFWFCQREAIETLIYLFEIKRFDDLEPVIKEYTELKKGVLGEPITFGEDLSGRRTLYIYRPEFKKPSQHSIPKRNLLRYAFKMATGSGKTCVMALIAAWSYFNRRREKNARYADNFLIIAPNVIVYERLEKDFGSNDNIFNKWPIIPPAWLSEWQVKITLRGDDSPLWPSGNIILNNIQQLYESRQDTWTPANIIDAILGKKPQKDLTKPPKVIMERIKELDNLLVMNDEAHHVHDENLKWYETLESISNSIPNGITLWLDFSATPKTQESGDYFPWIIVDYPLAQAVEDRIVKAPLIVHRIDKKDPENVSSDNVVQKYGDWIEAALTRWKEHYSIYQEAGKKVVLFIMAEKNIYADKIGEAIKKQGNKFGFSDDEVLVVHTDSTGEVRKSELDDLRAKARKLDEPENKIKIIVSVLMLKEGWDVQNVTVTLGLRSFSAKAEILPEQTIGRGLRLMKGISPDYTQTLEVMGNENFEEVVRKLEEEGVGINTVKSFPSPGIWIVPEMSKRRYDIEIPQLDYRYRRDYTKLSEIDLSKIRSLYESDKLEEDRKIRLREEFLVTGTEVGITEIEQTTIPDGRESLAYITKEVIKRAGLTPNYFSDLYPIVEKYVLTTCFKIEIESVDDGRLRKHLADLTIQEAIIDLLAKEIGTLTAEPQETVLKTSPIVLSNVKRFYWQRKSVKCNKTIFNYVATYNNYEIEFAEFLDRCPDIEKFSSLNKIFRIDYLKSSGAIGFYWPDFIAVQIDEAGYRVFWIIETKGREYPETDRKDAAISRWCDEVTEKTKERWRYVKVQQILFNKIKKNTRTFSELIEKIHLDIHKL